MEVHEHVGLSLSLFVDSIQFSGREVGWGGFLNQHQL